jgi:hypothetical protein
MTDEQEENSIRLLNIIDSVALLNKDAAHLELPFSVDEKGSVKFSDALHLELSKPENSDLLDWAHANLIDLFE